MFEISQPILKITSARISGVVLLIICGVLSGCSDTPTGDITLNEPGGMVLSPPEFLQARAINQNNVAARVSVVADGVTYEAVQTNSTSAPWIGQVYVPEGSSPTVNVMWVETQVIGLLPVYNGELPLAMFSADVGDVDTNQSLEITTDQYTTRSTTENPVPLLDVDSDGASNIEERQAGSRPGDAQDIPSSVLILYREESPVIDGEYDELWNTAQYRDQDGEVLGIDKWLIGEGIMDPSLGSNMRWGAMHDGTYLYLIVFAENGPYQTPNGDSGDILYEDDSVDIYLDGNNSKGAGYDGVDDIHFIIALLDGDTLANDSDSDSARIQTVVNSSPIDLTAIEYAVCLCGGNGLDDQQVYEIRLNLEALNIPVDTTFGLDVSINNDNNGGVRDAKWAWFNDTGVDDTW
ncbi:hypothetical protein N9850_08710, partial [Granulosicoccus sp.]